MTTPATPADKNAVQVPPSPEENLRNFWARYGNMVYIAVGLVALGILAKGGIDYVNAQKELGIQKEFSECVSAESFKAFVANHPGHPLTGVSELFVGDNYYVSAKYPEAAGAFTAAISDLPKGAVRDHARIGLALSEAQSGKTADAEAALKQLLDDSDAVKTYRCEAGYRLAVLSIADGRSADVQNIAEKVLQIDPTSPFAERTFTLRGAAGSPADPSILKLPPKS
jgi:hypothetical protein